MAEQSPLRHWKPFFATFDLVDAAIEAAVPALCCDEIYSRRGEIVDLLCGVPAGKAEQLCVALDGFMAESLLTLMVVPTKVVPNVLKSSADLSRSIGALRLHLQSARVRGLARDVSHGWTAIVEDDVARAKEWFDTVCGVNKAAREEASRRLSANTKKRGSSEEEERMEATKRKLREGYREAEDAKEQRKIQVIAAP